MSDHCSFVSSQITITFGYEAKFASHYLPISMYHLPNSMKKLIAAGLIITLGRLRKAFQQKTLLQN